MLFLSGNDIRACLSYNEVMNSVEEALRKALERTTPERAGTPWDDLPEESDGSTGD